MRVLHAVFVLMYTRTPVERKIIGVPKRETFVSNSVDYEIETMSVMYVLQGRLFFIPRITTYGTIIRGKAIKENVTVDLGSKEYPLLVPKLFKNTDVAHVMARRRYLADISEEL